MVAGSEMPSSLCPCETLVCYTVQMLGYTPHETWDYLHFWAYVARRWFSTQEHRIGVFWCEKRISKNKTDHLKTWITRAGKSGSLSEEPLLFSSFIRRCRNERTRNANRQPQTGRSGDIDISISPSHLGVDTNFALKKLYWGKCGNGFQRISANCGNLNIKFSPNWGN